MSDTQDTVEPEEDKSSEATAGAPKAAVPPSPEATPAPQDTQALRLRQALYGGLFGSLGATVGWLLWVAVYAFRANPWEVILAPVVGAAVGLLNEWWRDYRRVARREAAGEDPEEAHEAASEGDSAPHYGRAARVGAVTLVLLGVICEHLVADLIRAVLVPFLSSLATLFPCGALFAWLIARGRSRVIPEADRNPYYSLVSMVCWGLGAMCLASGLRLAMGEANPWAGSGYWVLIGMGLRLTSAPDTPVDAPVLGVAFALLLLIGSSIWNVESVTTFGSSSSSSSGTVPVIGPVVSITAKAADDVLKSPDVPARFWNQAQEEITKSEQGKEKNKTNDAGSEATEGHEWEGLCRWVGCDNISNPVIKPLNANEPFADQLRRQDVAWDYVDRKRNLCRMLHQGWGSPMARSWLVVLLFGLGLSVGAVQEARNRPRDYRGSLTRRHDLALTCGVLALIATTVLILHFLSHSGLAP